MSIEKLPEKIQVQAPVAGETKKESIQLAKKYVRKKIRPVLKNILKKFGGDIFQDFLLPSEGPYEVNYVVVINKIKFRLTTGEFLIDEEMKWVTVIDGCLLIRRTDKAGADAEAVKKMFWDNINK